MSAINLACSSCSSVLWQDRPSARQKENVLTVLVCILIKPPPIPCQSKGKEICVGWIECVELRVVSWYDIGGHGLRCGCGCGGGLSADLQNQALLLLLLLGEECRAGG